MKRTLLILSFATLLLAGCRDHYTRPAVKPEDEGIGTLIRYGNVNSVIAYDKSTVELDVKAYKVNEMNHNTFSPEEDVTAPKAVSAGVVWYEEGFTVGSTTVSGGKLIVDGISGFGNAVVGIYDESGRLLWSYLVWKPKDNPDECRRYATNGGCYVMPMALGAMEYGRFNDNGRITNLKETAGLFFQNNRKDPLGRPDLSNLDASKYVNAYRPDGSVINWNDDVASADNILAGIKSDLIYKYQQLDPNISYREAVQAATDDMAEMDAKFMFPIIDFTIENPTTVVTSPVGCSFWYCQDSIYRCRHLWFETKTCYDPCPEGYMLPPATLFYGFLNKPITTISEKEDGTESSDALYAGGPHTGTINARDQEYSITNIKGYDFFYYGSLDPTALDYYPAAGYRDNASGILKGVGADGWYGSFTQYFSSTYGYIRLLHFSADTLQVRYGYAPRAMSINVRCIKITTFEDSSTD